MNLLNLVHDRMSILPLWVQLIIGIGSLLLTIFIITIAFPALTNWVIKKFTDLNNRYR